MTSFLRLDILPPAQRQLWPELKKTKDEAFVLYGGTAVALFLGHRESVDFDFFTDRSFQPEDLVRRFPFLKGAEFLQSQPNTLTALTSGSDDDTQRVKVSFFGGFSFGRLEDPQQTPDDVLEVASLQDLLAHKLKVLLQRVETKDYLDIDALLNSGLDLARGLAGARALFPAFAPQECLKALTYFNDPPLKTLSIELRERLLKAAGSVQVIPHMAVKSKTLSKR
jgi:hypothetical protein